MLFNPMAGITDERRIIDRMNRIKTLLKPIITFLCLFSLICFPAFSEPAEDNLLFNGSFEILDEDGLPDGWFPDAYILDPGYSIFSVETGKDGMNAASVCNTAGNDARFAQTVSVKPETLYCLSGFISADGITGGHGANLSVEGVYAFSKKLYETDGEWEYIEYYGETGPDQHEITVFARVGGYSGESKGTARFDQLCLKEAHEVPEGIYADLWYSEDEYSYSDDEEPVLSSTTPGPAWPVLGVASLLYGLLLIGVLYYYRKENTALIKPRRFSGYSYLILFAALAARMVISFLTDGYEVDVNCFTSWGYTMSVHGPAGFYQHSGFCDYPPLYTYILGFNSWLTRLTQADAGWTRIIFRFIPSFCDVAACWMLLHLPGKKDNRMSHGYSAVILLFAFNPAAILNSAAWGQMDSVLCIFLLAVAILAVNNKWIPSILLYVTAVLIKPQALMLGILGLVYIILVVMKEPVLRKKIAYSFLMGFILIFIYILPFSIKQSPGWLINLYSNTLSSYPYATVNTANLYYIAGGNWSKINASAQLAAPIFLAVCCGLHGALRYVRNRKEKLIAAELAAGLLFSCFFIVAAVCRFSWALIGTCAMVYSFVIVISMAIRYRDLHFLPYLGAMLFILLYVFGVKMHERYLFPAFLLLMYAWAEKRDWRILLLALTFSLTVFMNEGIILDNSIRLGASLGHLNSDTVWLADILSVINIAGAVCAVVLGYDLMKGQMPSEIRRLPSFLPVKTVPSGRTPDQYHPDNKLHWSLPDSIVLCSITILFSIVTFTTLGSTKAPQTGWSSSSEAEQVIIDTGSEHTDIRMLYFAQVSRNDFSIASSRDGIHWTEEIWAQMDQQQCWKWKYVTQSFQGSDGERTYYNDTDHIVHFNARYLRISSHQVGLTLNEIILRDSEGKTIPATILSRSGENKESELLSDPSTLLDEQDTLEGLPGFFRTNMNEEAQPSWWNSTYFDEIYHARTGFEFMNGTTPYETSHPPLGKVFISWFISLFGMTPFGWRFAGALAGVLMLPGIYLLAKQLTKKTLPASLACGLLALDCMHLTQTQIATIDSFPVLFIIYAFLFMLRFIQTDLSKCSLKDAMIPLAVCGFNMALSIACKWIGIYAGIGLAVLYFWHCIRHLRLTGSEPVPDNQFICKRIFTLSCWCILFFILIPLLIYILSYIPYFRYNHRIKTVWDYLASIWRAQESMLSYHSTPGLGMDHPFYSPWWEWPIIGKPMYYAAKQYIPAESDLQHSIFCFGNPAVWWGAFPAILIILYRYFKSKHYLISGSMQRWHMDSLSFSNQYGFLFVGFLAQYLPWVLVPRGTYIYHYFASIPFLILFTVSCFDTDDSTGSKPGKAGLIIGCIYIALAFALFMIFLPYASGMAAPKWWLDLGKQILRIWY